jgi:hypothetical protein
MQSIAMGAAWLVFAVSLEVGVLSNRVHIFAALLASVGVVFLARGAIGLRRGPYPSMLTRSFNLLQAGRTAEAEALLDRLEQCDIHDVARARDFQRATLALRRGQITEVLRLLGVVLERKVGVGEGMTAVVQHAEARALRAWVRAASGDVDGALADCSAVRGSSLSPPSALARAALADALVAERRGDRKALAMVLARDRRSFSAGLDLHERSVVRALRRLLGAGSSSVYRIAASSAPADGSRSDWLEQVAPRLRDHGPRAVVRDATSMPVPCLVSSRAKADPSAQSRELPSKGSGNVLLGYVISGAAAVGVLQLAFGGRGTLQGTPSVSAFFAAHWGIVPALAAVAGIAWVLARTRKQVRRLNQLGHAVSVGDDVDTELEALSRSSNQWVAACAEMLRASVAERRADFSAVLDHVRRARYFVRSETMRPHAGPVLAPTLTVLRAEALAAMKRKDDAAEELETLPADYLLLDRARFSVHLTALVAEGDIEAAGRLVRATSPELSVGPRDEIVRDLVLVATDYDNAEAELARLRMELREDDETRAWLQRVSPQLLAVVELADVEDAEEDEEFDAEAEAQAEALEHEKARAT